MKMFSALAALLVAVAVAAATAVAGPATTTVERYVVQFDQISPPHHDCITESVHYEGSYEVTIVTVYNGGGGWTRSLHYRQRIDGTGLTTGTRYAIKAQYSEVVHESGDSTPYVSTFPISYVEISRGGRENYLATGLFHVTVNANGESVAAMEFGSIRCLG
jgi:hypothetical protein